jgi:hypothetical protein
MGLPQPVEPLIPCSHGVSFCPHIAHGVRALFFGAESVQISQMSSLSPLRSQPAPHPGSGKGGIARGIWSMARECARDSYRARKSESRLLYFGSWFGLPRLLDTSLSTNLELFTKAGGDALTTLLLGQNEP